MDKKGEKQCHGEQDDHGVLGYQIHGHYQFSKQ
jgi:hypothetical protein